MAFHYNEGLYRIKRPVLTMASLLPGLSYEQEVEVLNIDEGGGAEPIRVFVCHPQTSSPIVSAVINMPLSELLLAEE